MKSLGVEKLLSSDPNYENFVAEIYYNGIFIALLNQDDGINNLKIEFPGADVIEEMVLRKMDIAIFEEGLALAKKRLTQV